MEEGSVKVGRGGGKWRTCVKGSEIGKGRVMKFLILMWQL